MSRAVCLALIAGALGARQQREDQRFLLSPRVADKFKRTADERTSYYPSITSYEFAKLKEYRAAKVTSKYTGNKKILVLGSSEFLLKTSDGRYFNTGHHSTESFLPLHHLDAVGLEFDFATEEGEEMAFEEWTFDLAVGYKSELRAIQSKYSSSLKAPMKYADIRNLSPYAAVFIPGGHGPLIGMQFNAELGRVLRLTKSSGKTLISLCHGPVAFVAGAIGGNFPYSGYKLAVFPDKQDESSPAFGYLPSKLDAKYHAEEKLRNLGMIVMNKDMDRTVIVDREMITGSSQLAAQPLAEKALEILSKDLGFAFSF